MEQTPLPPAMTTRAEEIAAEGPYKAYYHAKSDYWKVKGPTKVEAGWTRSDWAEDRARDLNAAYKQGQQDRWIPVTTILPSAANAVDGDVLTLSPTQTNILPWQRLHEPMCPVTHWAPLPPNPEQR